jgi:hypothetical protein
MRLYLKKKKKKHQKNRVGEVVQGVGLEFKPQHLKKKEKKKRMNLFTKSQLRELQETN